MYLGDRIYNFLKERKNNMINIDGVELSEDTVRNALKKAGISLEKKHKFKPGDVCLQAGWDYRLIFDVGNGRIRACDREGRNPGGTYTIFSQEYFDTLGYKYIGRFEDMIKEYMDNHPELKG